MAGFLFRSANALNSFSASGKFVSAGVAFKASKPVWLSLFHKWPRRVLTRLPT
jgi:hypothetical protein